MRETISLSENILLIGVMRCGKSDAGIDSGMLECARHFFTHRRQ